MLSRTIEISDQISLPRRELGFSFVRSQGPGGQNVNKLATAAQLRFDIRNSPSLPAAVAAQAEKLAGRRLTADGVIVINASRHRTQALNRDDALGRLVTLLRKAAVPPRKRRATRPSPDQKKRRTDAKTRRGALKKLRCAGDSD